MHYRGRNLVRPRRRAFANVTIPEGQRDAREWHTELPGGIILVDIGAPPRRLPSEPQAVLVKAAPAAASAPAKEAEAAPTSAPRRVPRPVAPHRAITKAP